MSSVYTGGGRVTASPTESRTSKKRKSPLGKRPLRENTPISSGSVLGKRKAEKTSLDQVERDVSLENARETTLCRAAQSTGSASFPKISCRVTPYPIDALADAEKKGLRPSKKGCVSFEPTGKNEFDMSKARNFFLKKELL